MSVLEIIVTPLGWALRRKRAGQQRSLRHAPQLAALQSISITSPSFASGEVIPARHTAAHSGANVSPELCWSALPAETAQLVLIIEDVDSPFRRPSVHTIALFSPDGDRLAEGALTPDSPRFRYIANRHGDIGYAGPRPLPGHGVHHYGFHLYALDDVIPLDVRLDDVDDLLLQVDGHVVGSGFLEGVRQG